MIYSLNQLQDKHTESLILLTQDQLSSSNDNYNTYILLKNMEEDDDKSIIHIIKPKLKVQETINHQILSIVHGKTDLAIQPFLPFFDYLESHGYITKNLKSFKNNDYKQVISFGHKEASVLFSYITNIGVFREELYLASNTTFFKKAKTIIFSGYIICWGYILLLSTQAQNLIVTLLGHPPLTNTTTEGWFF